MKKYFFFLLGSVILAQFMACDVSDDTSSPVRDQYIFDQAYTLSNVKDTYLPNDFIFMEYKITDKMMTDSVGQKLRVGNARMFPTFTILGPLDGSSAGEDRFEVSLVEGEIVEGENDFSDNGYLKFNIGCPDNLEYTTKINLTFPEAGGYLMYLDYDNSPLHTFPFTADDDCFPVNPGSISDDADIGNVQFFFDVADTNRDEFDDYIAEWEAGGTVVDEKADFELALDEKRAYFVWVQE